MNGIGYAHSFHGDGYVACPQFLVAAGDRFALGDTQLLALDELTRQLIKPLTAYFGANAGDTIDRALIGVMRGETVVIHGDSNETSRDLVRALHRHSARRYHPLKRCTGPTASDHRTDEFCIEAAHGTMYFDMQRPFTIPLRLARHVFSTHFDLWPIVVTPAAKPRDAVQCFGRALWEPKRQSLETFCFLGFPQRRLQSHLMSAVFRRRRE